MDYQKEKLSCISDPKWKAIGNIITCSVVVSRVGNQTCEYWDKDEVWLLYYWYAKIVTLHMTLVYTCLKHLIDSKFLEERDRSLASCVSQYTGPSCPSSQPVYSNLLMQSFNSVFVDKMWDTARCISPIAKASMERKLPEKALQHCITN